MAYWILQGRLTRSSAYHLPPGIQPSMDCWRIRYYANEVSIGDIAFIWYPNPDRGIYNVSKVVYVPHPPNVESERLINILWGSFRGYIDPDKYGRLSRYPAILMEDQYLDDLRPPVLMDDLRKMGLHDLPVIRMPQAGIYRLDELRGKRLLDYILRTQGRQ